MTTRPDMKRFRKVDDSVSVLVIAGDYLFVVVVAMLSVAAGHPLATFAAIPLIAGRQVAFLNLVHAAAHYSLFSRRTMNNRCDIMIGYPIFDAVRPYRSYHLDHHRYFAVRDPERFDYLHDQLPKDSGAWCRTWYLIVRPILGWAGSEFIQVTVEQCRENPRFAWRLGAYWLVVIVAFSWAGWLTYLVLYWIVPLVWLYPVFYSWAELSDHYAVEQEARNQRGLFYSLFLKGHEMYHAVHHLYPNIPFYRIAEASRHLASTGEHIEETRGIVDFVKILYRPVHQQVDTDGSRLS